MPFFGEVFFIVINPSINRFKKAYVHILKLAKSSKLKILYYSLILSFLFFSCKKTENDTIKTTKLPKEIVDFGLHYNSYDVVQDTIRQGDTFGSILEKQNLDTLKVHQVVEKISDSINLKKIKTGKIYTLFRSKDIHKKLQYLVYQPDKTSYYIIEFAPTVTAKKVLLPLSFKRKTIAGTLQGSLSETLKNEGASAALTAKLIGVYKWSIDFFKSKLGDKFAITYTERYINDTIFDGVEDLECSFFEYKGKKIYAFPFAQDTTSGKIEFYDENGKALRNFFLKAPLKSINITSKYSKNRFHPVQNIWKAHNGTDYAAPTGTPIMTTATGVVEQTGYTAGNGNFVKVKHNSTYSTQYLHMSRILVRRGQAVRQGDVIGKVGSTGLATGPHVCYRFWKNGKQVDALRLKLPNSEPMRPKNIPRYLTYIAPLKRVLDSVAIKLK
jgi:murein DD-endopeptidase MepM/ murein hydrolase activator NlpD